MPGAKRKNGKRAPRKKVFRGKRKQTTTLVNKSLQPFPSRFIIKQKYNESFALSALNGYTQVMNLNSVFDPNRTGIGHQPYGYDQMTPIYNRYRVISCSYVLMAYSATSTIRYGCIPANDTPPINNMSELCEHPRSRWKLQLPGGNTQYLKGRVSLPALMGRTTAQYMADDRYQAEVGTNPQELALLYITGQSMGDGASDFVLNVSLEYTVEYFDPKPIDQS